MSSAALEEYLKARKMAQKAYRQAVMEGKSPYPQVLDAILENASIERQEELGIVSIPMEHVAGTRTAGRTAAFACNFMPLLDPNTEFGVKWRHLYDAQVDEGIRDPVRAYEFCNRFYVEEGNKRVSVLKYMGASSVRGRVTRLVPARSDTPENHLYYEFLDFYRDTHINYIWFTRPGSFARLCTAVGQQLGTPWQDKDLVDFFSVYMRFQRAFYVRGGRQLTITPGDALLAYLELVPYREMDALTDAQLNDNLDRMWDEIQAIPRQQEAVAIHLQPSAERPGMFRRLFTPAPHGGGKLKVAFVHEFSADTSPWTAAHEFGRRQLENALAGQVETIRYDNVQSEEDTAECIEAAIEQGAEMVFTTTPKLIDTTVRMAVRYPDVKMLNCSLNMPHPAVRTYYPRVYEVKFLIGVLAGALAENDKVGYIANYPIFGVVANINAFARGVAMVNPRARVYLRWTCLPGQPPEAFFAERGIQLISTRDIPDPTRPKGQLGLYRMTADGETEDLASPFWDLGKFYELLVRQVLDGSWEKAPGTGAINYWWGMGSGVLDLLFSRRMPEPTRRLAELLKSALVEGRLSPFDGNFYDQTGKPIHTGAQPLTPQEILHMRALAENVVGAVPALRDILPESRPMVEKQGIYGPEEKA